MRETVRLLRKTVEKFRSRDLTPVRVKRRILHHSGFYRKEVTLILFAIILNIFLYAGFIFTLPIVISHHKKMNLTVSRIVNADIASYQSAFLYYQTYLYVSQNKSGTLRNITLEEQWNVTMTTLNQMQTNFTKLAQELREEEDGSEVLSYLIGNECEIIVPLTAGTAASCPTGLKGSMTKGLLQVSSYVMAVCQNIKNIFDASQRSKSDMRNALTLEGVKFLQRKKKGFLTLTKSSEGRES